MINIKSPAFSQLPNGGAIFLDVDGVLLDYDVPFVKYCREYAGKKIPEDFRSRSKFYLSDWIPDQFNKKEESALVERFGMGGGMARLEGLGHDRFDMGIILSSPGVYILSSFPEEFRLDRIAGLYSAFGFTQGEKIFAAWNGVRKGEVIHKVCSRYGMDPGRCLMVDDLDRNLDSAASVGCMTFRTKYEYNSSSHHPGVITRDLVGILKEFYWSK